MTFSRQGCILLSISSFIKLRRLIRDNKRHKDQIPRRILEYNAGDERGVFSKRQWDLSLRHAVSIRLFLLLSEQLLPRPYRSSIRQYHFQYPVELPVYVLDFIQKFVLLTEHLVHLAAQVIIHLVELKDELF